MAARLSPIISEFETESQAQSYDTWFRRRVADSLADPRPNIPHDQALSELRSKLAESRAKRVR